MQFQVPQGIDMEDKIVGPLTLIQFLYLLVGGVIDYLLFLNLKGNFIFWILALPITIFTVKAIPKRRIGKSELEKLAYTLDTQGKR